MAFVDSVDVTEEIELGDESFSGALVTFFAGVKVLICELKCLVDLLESCLACGRSFECVDELVLEFFQIFVFGNQVLVEGLVLFDDKDLEIVVSSSRADLVVLGMGEFIEDFLLHVVKKREQFLLGGSEFVAVE